MSLPVCALIRIVTDAGQQHDHVNWSLSHAHAVCGTEPISIIAATRQLADVVTHDRCKQWTLNRQMLVHYIGLT